MKKTLITIGATAVVVLTLAGLVGSFFGRRVNNTFSAISSELPAGYGGGAPALEAPMPSAINSPAQDSFAANTDGNKSITTDALPATQERKVIKNDQLSLVVKDPTKNMKDIIALAEKLGGYVVSSNLYQTTYGPNNVAVPQASVVVRVPADKLTDALDEIKKGAIEVQSENLTGQDVTDQYVDLQSRLTADQAAADQLTKIMQSAVKTEDVLSTFQQLRQLQSDIEVLKGQIKLIDESTATSEINVTLIAEESVQPIEIGGWKLQGTARNSIQDLINFTQGFTRFLIQLILFALPALILIIIPLYLVFLAGRGIYRRFKKSKVVVEEKEEVVVKK